MDNQKLFKSLKNGKDITLFYTKNEEIKYTVHLDYKNALFLIHSYVFDGNNVLDEGNYKDESIIERSDFNDFIQIIRERFPGMIENWNA